MTSSTNERRISLRAATASLRSTACIALLSIMLSMPGVASAIDFKSMVVFGDSNSDTGNLYRATNRKSPSPTRYYRGRFSNGRIWAEHLGSRLRVPVQVKAYGGARSGYGGVSSKSRGMRAQVDAYLARYPRGIDRRALFIIWIGPNDVYDINKGKSEGTVSRGAANNVATAVAQLKTAGARSIAVMTMPDLGVTPFGRGKNGIPSSRLSRFSRRFNNDLRGALRATGIAVKVVDVYPLLRQLQSAPNKYGLSDAKRACLAIRCKNPQRYLFWDDRHLTTQGHRLLAEFVRSKL